MWFYLHAVGEVTDLDWQLSKRERQHDRTDPNAAVLHVTPYAIEPKNHAVEQ